MSPITQSHAAFHRGTAAIFAILTPQQTRELAALTADPELEQRIEELAGKSNEGELTPAERSEYEGYVHANNLLAVLQAEARLRLKGDNP